MISLSLTGDYFGSAPTAELEAALIGTPLREDALRAALTRLPYPVGAYIFGAEAEDLVALLLGRTDTEPSTT